LNAAFALIVSGIFQVQRVRFYSVFSRSSLARFFCLVVFSSARRV
jgi:hypothetical protein